MCIWGYIMDMYEFRNKKAPDQRSVETLGHLAGAS